MSESKVKLKEAENDTKKQMEMLETSSMPQAIAVFSHYTMSWERWVHCECTMSGILVHGDTSETSPQTRRGM